MNDIYAVVILYNPGFEIIENIKSYISQVKKLYVMDNSETINKMCINKIMNISDKIEYQYLYGNKGIGYPINRVIEKLPEGAWLLTMDQDSYFHSGTFLRYIKIIESLNDNVYGISPKIIYKDNIININKSHLKPIYECIQSGAIFNVKILKLLGGFNEKFFIDAVDREYCYRCNKFNYKLYQNNEGILVHKLGKKINNAILKYLHCNITQHSVLRRYYIVRNNLYLKDMYPNEKIRIICYLIAGIIKIALLDNNRIQKLKAALRGYKDYKRKIYGKYILRGENIS